MLKPQIYVRENPKRAAESVMLLPLAQKFADKGLLELMDPSEDGEGT